jgi:threonine/homoserine/homoserine lactone efflux protein
MIPTHSSLPLFITGAVVLLVIPGPAVFYIVGRSIDQGRRAGVISALGIATGALVHVTAAALGLSALLVSSATAFSVVKYLGAAFLIYLGFEKLYRKSDAPEPAKFGRIFRQGVVVSVLNPKEALFFFAFLPQFVDYSEGSITAQILFLGLLFICMGVTSDTLWALSAGTLAQHLKRNTRWLKVQRYVSGGMLISLGVATAFAGSNTKK